MPKVVYVLVKGSETPARIKADAVSEKKSLNAAEGSLVLTIGDVEVGKFVLAAVVGWWVQEE